MGCWRVDMDALDLSILFVGFPGFLFTLWRLYIASP
jgi:hypothetical protein